MRKDAGLGARLQKLNVQAKTCTPPGGKAIAKIRLYAQYNMYSTLRQSDLCLLRLHYRRVSPSTFYIFPSRRLAATATFIHRYGILIHRRCCIHPTWAALLECQSSVVCSSSSSVLGESVTSHTAAFVKVVAFALVFSAAFWPKAC